MKEGACTLNPLAPAAVSRERHLPTLLLLVQRAADVALKSELEQLGYLVERAGMGPQAITSAMQSLPNMVIIDCRGSRTTGLQICRSLRSFEETASLPLTVVAGRDEEDWRSEAAEAGVDIWLVEPESLLTFLRHFRALENRLDDGRPNDVLRYSDVQLDLKRFKAHRNGRLVHLTTMQMRLLKHFLEHPTIVFSREELLRAVWRNESLDEGAVTACVARVRRALNAGGGPNLIRSVLKEGYALVDEGAADGAPVARR